jgi:hypothetical protein
VIKALKALVALLAAQLTLLCLKMNDEEEMFVLMMVIIIIDVLFLICVAML